MWHGHPARKPFSTLFRQQISTEGNDHKAASPNQNRKAREESLIDIEKAALAAAIRTQTPVPLLRLAEHLPMGTTGYVSMQTRRHLNAH